MKILITGINGAVGSTLVAGLKDKYQLRGLDLDSNPDVSDTFVGSIADFDTVIAAIQGMDVVIHLANSGSAAVGEHRQTAGIDLLPSENFVGTYNLLEAARQNGVRRFVYASRAGLLSPYPQSVFRTIDMMPRPESYYSVSKAFGEDLGYMYTSQSELEFVAVRIGNFNRDRPEPEHPHHLGHVDAVHLFEQAVIHPNVKFEIVFGVSDSTWHLYDLDHGRKAIGYYPKQKSNIEPDI
ncbi:MAG: NAD(P)-dependent oxidoreductase [Candidatus Poribacteria bacterium]|jgi:uronate dehydrogenase